MLLNRFSRSFYLPVAGLLLATLSTGCFTARPANSSVLRQVAADNCQIDSSGTSGYVFHPTRLVPGSAEASLLGTRYGERGLRMAQAIGLTPQLVQLTKLEQQSASATDSYAYLSVRQNITDQLQLANADIATVSALLNCDTKRATLTANLLTRRENIREKRMTISAITIGAVAIIGASILNLHGHHETADWFHIGGGVGEGGLGILALRQKAPETDYAHARNPLRELWNQPRTSATFPPLVWYYLTQPKPGDSLSIAETLRNRWKLLLSLDATAKQTNRRSRVEVDYFGNGGAYNAEALTLRATMLGQLETEVRLMNNDLTILLNEIVRPAARR